MRVSGELGATQMARLQKVQNFAARIVANLRRTDHVSATLSELGWPTVERMVADADMALIRQLMLGEAEISANVPQTGGEPIDAID